MALSTVRQILIKMLEYCETIENYMQECRDSESFVRSRLHRDAVVLNILQIGELATLETFRTVEPYLPTIPWKQVRDTRHKLTHHYEKCNDIIIYENSNNRYSRDIPSGIRVSREIWKYPSLRS